MISSYLIWYGDEPQGVITNLQLTCMHGDKPQHVQGSITVQLSSDKNSSETLARLLIIYAGV